MMNSSKIIKCLRLNEKLIFQSWNIPKFHRTFLSEAYACQEAWDERLKSPFLQKIKPVDLFLELDQKYQSGYRVSAIDVDIFANIIHDESHVDEVADLLVKLRNTKETSNTLDSTSYAVTRYFMNVGEADKLLPILNDRLNYGIFCDYYCYNLLMDHFIKKQDFASAAKVATYMMLQEEFEHPIANALAIYSCHKYLEKPETWQEEDPEEVRKREEPKEEVKVRVNYILNPYFDDHFDLWKPSDLVGKTLLMIGRNMNDPLGRSCQLRGLLLYRKFEDAVSLLQKWKEESIKDTVYQELITLIKKDIPEIFEQEVDDNIKHLQKLLIDLENANLYQENLEKDLENLINKSIKAQSQEDISKQIELFSQWEEKRMQLLTDQLAFLDKQNRLDEIEETKKYLAERERLLTFFENQDSIELQIKEKVEKERELYAKDDKLLKEVDDNYISPENVRRTRRRRRG